MLWDRVGHAAVIYYGAGFAVVGSVALLMLVAEEGGKHKPTKISGSIRCPDHDCLWPIPAMAPACRTCLLSSEERTWPPFISARP